MLSACVEAENVTPYFRVVLNIIMILCDYRVYTLYVLLKAARREGIGRSTLNILYSVFQPTYTRKSLRQVTVYVMRPSQGFWGTGE